MSFFQSLQDFFQALFMSSSPEVKQRQALHKIENELKALNCPFYKNGQILGNFAETMRQLYVNTKAIGELLGETICSPDIKRNQHFEEQLLLTGFSPEAQEILTSLDFDVRKDNAREAHSLMRYFENEHKKLESVIKELNTGEFLRIDAVLNKIIQLNDICKYSYVSTLRLFDVNYSSRENYQPEFSDISTDLAETAVQDLYYILVDFDVSVSLNKAILALYSLYHKGDVSERDLKNITDNLKKIQYIVKRLFTKDILLNLARICKKDGNYVPNKARYHVNSRQRYADYLENHFRVDENRIKTELQDEMIVNELKALFGTANLLPLNGYTNDLNYQLKQSTQCSFDYILPMQIVKTFYTNFYETHARPLVNDIVIEGFFNNQSFKQDFSSAVFACNETLERIKIFESQFNRGEPFDEANISSLIHDSHKDSIFGIRLKEVVDAANKTAKEIIQSETGNINYLFKKIQDILVESKKPAPETIQNLKVLMISSRNREHTEIIEAQLGLWKIFLEIMKNYVIIGSIEKK